MKRDIPFGRPIIGDEERQAVAEVLDGPILVHGPRAKEFEAAFAAFTGAPHAVAVSNCTAALHLAYLDLGVGPGDEVIVPAQTHVATAHAVEFTGAKPVFVDAEIRTGNIDIDQIENKITDQTKAIAVVHFLGMPVDMNRVCAVAKKHGLPVVEDAALAIGTRYGGTHAGLLGDVGCFSFYPVKHITTAEGGMVLTKDPERAHRIERMRAFGLDRTVTERKVPGVYDVTMLGYNYRMNEIQAAIGIEQVKRLDGILAQRQTNYEMLAEGLREVDEVSLLESSHGESQSSYYCLSILLVDQLREKRFEFVRALNERGVGTSVYYPHPVPLLDYYRGRYGHAEEDFPVAAKISYGSVALPVGPHLNVDDMLHIASTVKAVVTEVC